ncbi:MAG: ATP-binding cassette domain-containing protein [Methanoregula sp.]|jgi:iron complex transport system ATP-binding protein|nr:ATP-binding cassette domain-containing protein [Methanoregula sp.]
MKPQRRSPRTDLPPLLEFSNIDVWQGTKKALNSLAVTVGEGEHVAILGPNGAGKSTFIKTVTRELYPDANVPGLVYRVHGQDVWDVFSLRSTIGIVSNDLQYTFTREIIGREVVLSGFFSSIGLFNQTVTPAMDRKADLILAFLEIEHLADRAMTTLSSGESRRLLIGRALVHNPKTLILDEPTNSLDLHALHAFRQTLRKVARSGTGIILVTHHVHDIIPEISRVILMDEGRFIRDGKKDAVLTSREIGRLFRVPVTVHEEAGWYYLTGY